MNNSEKIRKELLFLLRQSGSDWAPRHVPMTAEMRQLTDEQTAQRIYDELLKEFEEKYGIKFQLF